jgi:hypothetical protein
MPCSSFTTPKVKQRNACMALLRKGEGKSPFGITQLMLEDNIKIKQTG